MWNNLEEFVYREKVLIAITKPYQSDIDEKVMVTPKYCYKILDVKEIDFRGYQQFKYIKLKDPLFQPNKQNKYGRKIDKTHYPRLLEKTETKYSIREQGIFWI